MNANESIEKILEELLTLKEQITKSKSHQPVSEKWVSRTELMQFFNYGPTQMATLEHFGSLIVTKVGKRKFYLRKSVEDLLEQNIHPKKNNSEIGNKL